MSEPTASLSPAAGEVVATSIVEIGGDAAVLELCGRRVTLPAAELEGTPKPGDTVHVFIDAIDAESGAMVVSKEKADKLRLWDTLARAAESGGEVEGEVVAVVKGGLSVDVGMRAFLPASQAGLAPAADLGSLVGQVLRFKVVEFKPGRGSTVLSRRAILEAERAALREKTLATLSAGDIVTGTVKSFVQYGAFVDLGGVDGLLHVENMSWGHVGHPKHVLELGQQVKVQVLEIDREKDRISLGLKQLTEDPWKQVPTKYPVGRKVRGKVLRVVDFGAFVEIEPTVEGLLHASEMSWSKRAKRPADFVSPGDEVEVAVLEVDPGERRIGLGLKQLQPNPWEALRARYKHGGVVKGEVRSITDFGIFIGLDDDIDGLVHASDMSWTERVVPRERYKKGDVVEAAVLEVDVEAQRVALGIKQLTEDPWAALAERLPPGSRLTGRITKVVDFGAFVEVEPGIEGLCHVSELPDDAESTVKVDAMLEVTVLDIDTNGRRVSLSAKEAPVEPETPAPAPEKASRFTNSLADKLASKLKIEPKG